MATKDEYFFIVISPVELFNVVKNRILFFQVQACSSVEVNAVGNKVDDLLRKLEAAVNKAVDQAQKALDVAKAQLAEYATKYEVEADATMATDEKNWVDELTKLKAQAVEKKVPIDECLGDNENKLNNMETAYHNSMVQCVQGNIDHGTQYAQDALNKVRFRSIILLL